MTEAVVGVDIGRRWFDVVNIRNRFLSGLLRGVVGLIASEGTETPPVVVDFIYRRLRRLLINSSIRIYRRREAEGVALFYC